MISSIVTAPIFNKFAGGRSTLCILETIEQTLMDFWQGEDEK